MQCAVAGERVGGYSPLQKVENNYVASLSGEAGRKAKTLMNEGDRAIFGYLNSTLENRGIHPSPRTVTGIPKNNSQQFAQPNLSRPKTCDGLLAPLHARD